jgi:hypothetical protein
VLTASGYSAAGLACRRGDGQCMATTFSVAAAITS